MISKQEQQVKDTVTDFACDTCQDCERDIADNDIVAIVVKKIMDVFKQPQKDTRSRRERKLDEQFAAMDIKPRVYHFTKDIATFNAVTVALTKRWRKDVTEDIVKNCVESAHQEMENKATFSIAILKQARLYGVAICDKSDQFSKRTGRMKAKGRLMQHLLKEANKE